jgi:hypothetical protein
MDKDKHTETNHIMKDPDILESSWSKSQILQDEYPELSNPEKGATVKILDQ